MEPRFRYSRWDGTQRLDALDADQVLQALSDDLMSYGDLGAALQRLNRWGTDDLPGLEHLLRELRERREQELSRYDLDSTVEALRERLREVLATERAGIDGRVAAAPEADRRLVERVAQQHRDELDRMPEDLGGRVKALRGYDFMDEAARAQFESLLVELQRQMLDQMFQGMKQSIAGLTGQDLAPAREMVRDLNRMLEERRQGLEPDFAGFKRRHGGLFPDRIGDLDQLLEHLQRQMAQMQSLLRSLSPEARGELRGLLDQVLQDDALRLELARLGAHMQRLAPPAEMTERYPFFGDDPLSLQEAMGLMDRLQRMDRLEAQLERGSFRLEDVDRSLAEEVLGDAARRHLERMAEASEALLKAGYVERRGRRLELTPRGMRRIGQGALRDIFEQLKRSRLGQHHVRGAGLGTEPGEELKAYEYGDPFLLDLKETLFSALRRQGQGLPVQIAPADFIVQRTEHAAQASTVLMIDMSRSMFLRGCFLAAKKVAIALDALIRSQFPRDSLYVVGFSNHAVELKPQELPAISLNDYVYGTNMQHGFQVARSLLARHRGNRQIVMITDGEPTAHLEDGRVFFAYPPTFRTVQETLREVRRATRDHILINTFMLEHGPHLAEFVNQMTRINRGRAFFVSPDRLGEYLLIDYMSGRQRRRGARAG